VDGTGTGPAPGRALAPPVPPHQARTPGGRVEFRMLGPLQAWHDGGRQGPRPPGRLRPYALPRLSPVTRWWSAAAYRHLYDPDGRPPGLRRAAGF